MKTVAEGCRPVYALSATKGEFKYKKGRRKKNKLVKGIPRFDSPGGAIFHSLFVRYLIVKGNTHVPSGLLPKF